MENSTKIKDLYLAAFAYSKGKRLIKMERDGRTCWFLFEKCDDLVDEYWTDVALWKIKTYADSIRTLKDLIYSQ